MTASLTWVDAFTDTLGTGPLGAGRAKPFSGNPAGVCLPDEPLDEQFMQSLAFELGIAETAYVTPTPRADATTFDLRWFSPATEIDLCGHATLASAHALRERAVIDGIAPVTFHTRSGPLLAAFEGERIVLDFPADPMVETLLPVPLQGEWDVADLVTSGRTGFFALVVLARAAAVADYQPNLSALAAVDSRAVLITAAAEAGSGADYVLRVFGPNVGIDEDPGTGSAQCSAGPYWSAVLGRPALVAHQLSPRGAALHVRPEGGRVHIGGTATTVFEGHLC